MSVNASGKIPSYADARRLVVPMVDDVWRHMYWDHEMTPLMRRNYTVEIADMRGLDFGCFAWAKIFSDTVRFRLISTFVGEII
jgi:hypothetical protein